uniref:Uncharacterized protein n=1 Tax=Arion vulgaris TaxID=1028688 RepID=A0A0B7AZ08_9EUPU
MKSLWHNTGNDKKKEELLHFINVTTYGCDSWSIRQRLKKKIKSSGTACVLSGPASFAKNSNTATYKATEVHF